MKTKFQLLLLVLTLVTTSVFADNVTITYYADGDVKQTATVSENTPYTIADLSITGCRGYKFVGWKKGSPVEGDENPTILHAGDSFTPQANINLYAVYQKEDAAAANRFVRVTSTSDLHAGSKYLIVCYYEWDGGVYYGPSYYAMSNTQDTYREYNTGYVVEHDGVYYDVYADMYTISANQIFPNGGVVIPDDNAIVWTLGSEGDEWTWSNGSVSLYIRRGRATGYVDIPGEGTYTIVGGGEEILTGTGNSCTITASNGAFNFESEGYYLTYSDDDDDYFKMGTSNDWKFYLYKKESEYTSFPNCKDWKVNYDALDGTIGETGLHKTYDISSAGADVTLPSASIGDGGCDFDFDGWVVGAPLNTTTNDPESMTGSYSPSYDGETLYAVYSKSETKTVTKTKYTSVTAANQLTQNGDYIIVAEANGNYYALGNVETLSSTSSDTYSNWGTYYKDQYYSVLPTRVTVNASNEIEGEQSSAIEWRKINNNNRFQNVGNTSVYIKPSSSDYVSGRGRQNDPYINETHILGGQQNLTFAISGGKWAIYNGNNNLTYTSGEYICSNSNSRSYQFNIYKKTTYTETVSVTKYTSYPHCTDYKVHLHACGGKIKINGEEKTDVTFDEAITPVITLPGAPLTEGADGVMSLCPDSGWVFAGWLEGGELGSAQDIELTGLKSGNTTYSPPHDDTHLYAVYKRKINKFRIASYPDQMVAGEKYLLTWYDGTYDYEITPTASGTNLAGVLAVSPQDGSGWYIIASDKAVMWELGGTSNAWTFENVKLKGENVDARYLNIKTNNPNSGSLRVNNTATNFTIEKTQAGSYALKVYSGDRYVYGDNITATGCTFKTSQTVKTACYMYRQMSEYTSWPHCDAFTVKFDARGGSVSSNSLPEPRAYAGVEMPEAVVNSDCRKEGWTFAGWAESPIITESSTLPLDIWPVGSVYHPLIDNVTLYAVYYIKENAYKKISSEDEIRMGINYIIASGSQALSNTVSNSHYIASKQVTLSSNVITSEDADLDWRIQGSAGTYEFYNAAANGGAGAYLDLSSTSGYAVLDPTTTPANEIDNFYVTISGKAYIRSNHNLISSNNGAKYLGYTNSYFSTVTRANVPSNLNLYQQQATYFSDPNCVEAIDALRWDFANDSNFVYVESYLLKGLPNMHGSIGTPKELMYAADTTEGSIKIKYSTAEVAPGTKATIEWDGTRSKLMIPYVAKNVNTGVATLVGDGNADCSHCDVVVLPGKKLTIGRDQTLHNLTIYEGATLDVTDGYTLTVNSLILRCEDDQTLPIVNLNGSGSIVLNNNEIYFDARIDESRYYWYSLPFNAELQEISYSNLEANGGGPTYRGSTASEERPFWVKYYNGALRAADVNGGALARYWSHVADKGGDYTLQAGQGYIVGIGNQKKQIQDDGRHHIKRVLRFTLKPGDTWLAQERTGVGASSKVSNVVASSATDQRNAVHAGWNLIGNPYMHSYEPSSASGIVTGEWEEGEGGYYQIKEGDTKTVPYLTVYDYKDDTYTQELAAGYEFHPFEAVFVQINSGSQINFTSAMNVSAAPAYRRTINPDVPFYTGVELRGNNSSIDRTGIVLCNDYTPAYEIGADLVKMENAGRLNLYTINADAQHLAFNGLSDDDAVAPIPVGVTFPATGEYTFAFDFDHYDISGLEVLELIDKVQGTTTDLLLNDYSFVANQTGAVNDRFQIIVRRAQAPQTPTDIGETYDAAKPRKIIRNGQLFIIYDDKVYNAVGVEVR